MPGSTSGRGSCKACLTTRTAGYHPHELLAVLLEDGVCVRVPLCDLLHHAAKQLVLLCCRGWQQRPPGRLYHGHVLHVQRAAPRRWPCCCAGWWLSPWCSQCPPSCSCMLAADLQGAAATHRAVVKMQPVARHQATQPVLTCCQTCVVLVERSIRAGRWHTCKQAIRWVHECSWLLSFRCQTHAPRAA